MSTSTSRPTTVVLHGFPEVTARSTPSDDSGSEAHARLFAGGTKPTAGDTTGITASVGPVGEVATPAPEPAVSTGNRTGSARHRPVANSGHPTVVVDTV